jgi:hypothetical protein
LRLSRAPEARGSPTLSEAGPEKKIEQDSRQRDAERRDQDCRGLCVDWMGESVPEQVKT